MQPSRETGFFTDDTRKLIIFWVVNALICMAVRKSSALATMHAALIIGSALYYAIAGKRSEHVAYLCAYIVGAEVLWRMSNARVPYEVAKYAVALCSLITLGRLKRKNVPLAALAYFVLLLPGIFYPVSIMGTHPRLQKQISFYMSGPFCLTAAMCFCSSLSFTREQLWRLVLVLVTPILGTAAVAAMFTYMTPVDQLGFGTESVKVTSGGFGPNQVSALLGLGAVLLLLYIAQETLSPSRKIVISAALFVCIMQSALTFSRGGLYGAIGAFLPALVFLLRDRTIRARLAYLTVLGSIVVVFILIPYLVEFTGGAISKRFGDKKMSGREELVAIDLDIWKKNPVYGIGIGMSAWLHPAGTVSHNEITRVLAEHGAFGVLALLSLVAFSVQRILRARDPIEKAFIAAMFAWGLLFMSVNGFRIAAPAFVVALGCLPVRFRKAETELAGYRRFRAVPALAPATEETHA